MSNTLKRKEHEKRVCSVIKQRRTRFVLGSDTVCTSLLSSLRIVFVATPVVALLKCFMANHTTRSVRVEGKETCDAHHVGHTPGAR